ncbi:MAG TPA: ABC transporter permease [Firmicutes bacterium]|nr:ABC transporter permease [Bacillota bacterium]
MNRSAWKRVLGMLGTPVLAVVLGLAVGALLILMSGVDPGKAYSTFIHGAFGTRTNIGNTLSIFIPLLLTGLSVAFAMQARVLNMGAEGQLYFGALGATMVGLFLADLPRFVLLPLMLLGGFAFGALYGVIPGYLKAGRGVNEVVLTLMMNEIAIQLNSWAIRGPLHEPGGLLPQTAMVGVGARLPQLLRGTRVHYGLLLALAAALTVWFILRYTTFGYRIRAVGANPNAARFAGMNVPGTMVLAMVAAGGLAGLAGAGEVAGIHYRLMDSISPGYGYTGISVALLGRKDPVGVAVAALLMATLLSGAGAMQRGVGLPISIASLVQAVIILFILGTEYLSATNWRPAFWRRIRARAAGEVRGS